MPQSRYLKNKKNKEPTENTYGVPVKDPPKVKSTNEKSPITLKCKSLGNCTYLGEEETWCLYNGVELTKIS